MSKNGDLISSCVLKGAPNPSMMPFEFLGNGGFKGSIGQFNYYNTTLNAEQMKTEAQEEITRLEEESRLNYELPVLDMIG